MYCVWHCSWNHSWINVSAFALLPPFKKLFKWTKFLEMSITDYFLKASIQKILHLIKGLTFQQRYGKSKYLRKLLLSQVTEHAQVIEFNCLKLGWHRESRAENSSICWKLQPKLSLLFVIFSGIWGEWGTNIIPVSSFQELVGPLCPDSIFLLTPWTKTYIWKNKNQKKAGWWRLKTALHFSKASHT